MSAADALSSAACVDPLGLYASAIDESDYVMRVAPVIRALAPVTGDMIDVGAGGGQLGSAILTPGRRWTAIEPAPVMQDRLAALPCPPAIIPTGWKEAQDVGAADTVFAATMPAYFTDTRLFLDWCRARARQRIIWVVAAQNAPKGLILAGCLPAEWHREDMTPGIDRVLPELGVHQPDAIRLVDWTFRLTLPDLPAFAAWQAGRLGWAANDPRRSAHLSHLQAQATITDTGSRLSCARRSAILVWNL